VLVGFIIRIFHYGFITRQSVRLPSNTIAFLYNNILLTGSYNKLYEALFWSFWAETCVLFLKNYNVLLYSCAVAVISLSCQ